MASLALVVAAPGAHALSVDCQTANAENIAAGRADANGYTTGVSDINGTTGALTINNTVIDLPPNGLICVASVVCGGSSRVLTFRRNAANTPVYLLVEGNMTLTGSNCRIDVSGGAQQNRFGIGSDRLGGLGGPGGSDGGSCDFTNAEPNRAGSGVGPGGGAGAMTGGGGGGASPVASGGPGYTGAAGGTAYSSFDHRLLHGGSGGGCGANATGSSWNGGGGGGGVLVIGAGGTIDLSNSNSYITAAGGSGSTYGGGGAGGVVRLVADVIQGNGSIRVEGGSGSNCGTSSNYSGCAGHGVIKLEAPDGGVSGAFLAHGSTTTEALYYGVQQPIVPPTGEKPTLVVTSVTATWNGASQTVTPLNQSPELHVHSNGGLFLEAPASPEQQITVLLTSNNVPDTATVKVKMNAVGAAPVTVTAGHTSGSGSGVNTWTATLTVPGGAELGTIEAWILNVCTPGTAGCP